MYRECERQYLWHISPAGLLRDIAIKQAKQFLFAPSQFSVIDSPGLKWSEREAYHINRGLRRQLTHFPPNFVLFMIIQGVSKRALQL